MTDLITDTTITPGIRFTLLLIAIYGIPATRVVGIECNQVSITGDGAALTLGERQLSLLDLWLNSRSFTTPKSDVLRVLASTNPGKGPVE